MINNGKHQRDAGAQGAASSAGADPPAGRLRLGPVASRACRPRDDVDAPQSTPCASVIADRPHATSSRSPPRRRATPVESLYEIAKKIYPRAVHGLVRRAGAGRWCALTQLVFYGLPWLHVERPPGGAVRPRARASSTSSAWCCGRRTSSTSTGAADHRGAVAVPVHRGRRPPVVRLCLPADGLHRDLHVDRAQDRRRPRRAHAARRRAVVAATSSRARAASTSLWIALALWTGFTFVGYFTPIRDARRAKSLHARARARGKRSGSCSTASPPTATPASCASRCASTCARTRASRARCSTATR